MFPSSALSGAGTGGAIPSHRGVDLGPMRLSMPSGFLRRVSGPGRADPDIAAALAVR